MSDEIKNTDAIELSEAELDTVAGGFAISIGEGQSLAFNTFSNFSHKSTIIAQETFTGFGGSYTGSFIHIQETTSSAGQSLIVG